MKVAALVNAFLLYLRRTNEGYENRYQLTWLEKQANDFEKAMVYAVEALPSIDATDGQSYTDYLKTIHQHAAPEAYRIVLNAARSSLTKQEAVGYYRKDESFSAKIPPLFNTTDIQSSTFFRMGRMPSILDKRLELLGYTASEMTFREKTKAIHGQPAWREANDVIQIAEYIKQFIGIKDGYYFLRAYYKIHFLQMPVIDEPKHRLFAHHLEQEIRTIGKSLGLKFDSKKTTINTQEQTAYDRVYMTYASPKQIKKLMVQFANDLRQEIQQLDWSNQDAVVHFCYQAYLRFIHIHPFMDANYRTYTIFINALLSNHGYEYINFHDSSIKSSLSTHFNHQEPNATAAMEHLEAQLKKVRAHTIISDGISHMFFNQCTDDDIQNNTCAHSIQI